MHEFDPSAPEISSEQQDLFVQEIERLRPLLIDRNVEAGPEAEQSMAALYREDGVDLVTDIYLSQDFTVGNKMVTVSINETATVSEKNPAEPYDIALRHAVGVYEWADPNEEGIAIMTARNYSVEGIGTSSALNKTSSFRSSTSAKNAAGQPVEMRHDYDSWQKPAGKTLEDDDFPMKDFLRAILNSVQKQADFEEATGRYEHRFDTERFVDVMAILMGIR